jgi:hypothetical protein
MDDFNGLLLAGRLRERVRKVRVYSHLLFMTEDIRHFDFNLDITVTRMEE